MYKYFLSFLLYSAVIFFYSFHQYESKLYTYNQEVESSVKSTLDAVVNSFKMLNDSYHNQHEEDLAFIIKDATGASKEQRDKIRYKLREKFTALYNDRKLVHLNSFHIFDKNGSTILRFHKINKYDDTLKTRKSLQVISQDLKEQFGFEVGKYNATYKFHYLLFYDGEVVGSYEFGIRFDSIDKEMQKLFGIKNVLFIKKEYIDTMFAQDASKNSYKLLNIDGQEYYMLQTTMKKELEQRFHKVINMSSALKNLFNDKVGFVNYSHKGKDYIAVSNPIKNLNHQNIGFILTDVKDNISNSILETIKIELISALLFGLIVLYLLFEDMKYRKYIRNIIDTQHDILLVTDGKVLYDVNTKFLEFFNYKSLKSFKRKHSCVCDFFEDEEGFLHKDMNGITWFDYIKQNKEEEHIAIIYDLDENKRYFKIILEGFSHSSNYIVLFNDMTKEFRDRKELENKAYYDALTNIYSRERFDYYLNQKLHQKRNFSLIMFDIDHFKAINDIHGHDSGDVILKELTSLVSKAIRDDDIFARWGGEEFMIIINADISKAESLANKLRAKIQNYQFSCVESVTCSFGVIEYRKTDKFETMIKRVDSMLYSAKNSGRNCVVVVN